MGHIYRNVGPIDIPEGCGINRNDGRVYIRYLKKDGEIGRRKIGELAGPGKMYPSSYFKYKYPNQWEAITGEKPPLYELRIGLYLLYLAISRQTGLYDALVESMGAADANAIMDYALINAVKRDNAELLTQGIVGNLLFSPKAHGSKWYSTKFESITQAKIEKFEQEWLKKLLEKKTPVLKSQLDFSSVPDHSDGSVKRTFSTTFVSTVIRSYFEIACKELGLDINLAIRELDAIVLHMGEDNMYEAIHNAPSQILALLAKFGVSPATMDALATEVNTGVRLENQQRKLPIVLANLAVKKVPGRPRSNKPKPELPKRPRGRPKGSKNKKTLAREALMATLPPVIKRKPGRPKGSKNKKTLEREALAAKPKRGRPKGSKNKTAEEKAALMNAPRRPRGRPRKNKDAASPVKQIGQTTASAIQPEKTKGKDSTVLLLPLQLHVEEKAP